MTVPEIVFDENGTCQYCKIHDELGKVYPLNATGQQYLERLIADIKRKGKRNWMLIFIRMLLTGKNLRICRSRS